MKKRIAKLFLISVIILIVGACNVPIGIPPLGTNPTNEAMYTSVAQSVFMTLTAETDKINLELTKINTEIETSPISTSSIDSKNWLEVWLSFPACQPPCWEGIIPNQTTLRDSMKIIAQIPGVEFEWLYLTPHVNAKTTFVRWKFDSLSWGQVVTGANTNIISSIEFYPSDEQEITIKKIIDFYGAPSSVIRGSCFGEYFSPVKCGYVLLYKEKGMVLYTNASSRKDKPINITPDLQVTGINLFSQESIKIFDNDYQSYNEVVWEGFKTYEFPDK